MIFSGIALYYGDNYIVSLWYSVCMTHGDVCVPALSGRVSWWFSCLQMSRGQGTAAVMWVTCKNKQKHILILWAHLVRYVHVTTALLSQWEGGNLQGRLFEAGTSTQWNQTRSSLASTSQPGVWVFNTCILSVDMLSWIIFWLLKLKSHYACYVHKYVASFFKLLWNITMNMV